MRCIATPWQQPCSIFSVEIGATSLAINSRPTDSGNTHVMRRQAEVPAPRNQNRLGEPMNASVAIAHGHTFLRTHKHLWCIGANRQQLGCTIARVRNTSMLS